MSSVKPRNRRFVDSWIDAGSAALPYGFAVSGLALGVGALVTQIPLVGTCGAVAGVTAGLLSNYRAKGYRGQAVALRERLRAQRAQTDVAATELRSRVSALEVAVWEFKTLTPEPEVLVEEEAPVEITARPGLRLAAAVARINVPKTVLDAAVATTGSLSLADIANLAQKRAAEKQDAA